VLRLWLGLVLLTGLTWDFQTLFEWNFTSETRCGHSLYFCVKAAKCLEYGQAVLLPNDEYGQPQPGGCRVVYVTAVVEVAMV